MNTKIKFIDALRSVDKSEKNASYFNVEKFCNLFDIYPWDVDEDKLRKSLKSYWLYSWICTDTEVGVEAIFLYGKLVGYTSQNARKNDYNISFITRVDAVNVKELIQYCVNEVAEEYPLATEDDLYQEIDLYNSLEYAGSITHKDRTGFVGDREVTYVRRIILHSYTNNSIVIKYTDTGEECCVDAEEFQFRLHIE